MQPFTHFRGRVEKTNKSELRNPLTYRVLIYIFEVGMKTFFFNWSKSLLKKKYFNESVANALGPPVEVAAATAATIIRAIQWF